MTATPRQVNTAKQAAVDLQRAVTKLKATVHGHPQDFKSRLKLSKLQAQLSAAVKKVQGLH
jgi:hypothetical protein